MSKNYILSCLLIVALDAAVAIISFRVKAAQNQV